jgi:dTMP kinase
MIGKFIVLESIEAAGKGTATTYITEYVRRRSIPFAFTREPGGTEFAEPIREHMLKWEGKVPPICQALLSYAARCEHTEQMIIPKLESGINVFSERYYGSALAYQGQTYEHTKAVHELALPHLRKPDLTIFLDLPPEVSMKRMHDSRTAQGIELDEFEKKPIEYFRNVRDTYYDLMDDTWAIVDAEAPLSEVKKNIIALLDKVLGITPYENDACIGGHQ